MGMRASNVLRLGIKELRGLAADPVLLVMIFYMFTFAVYAMASGAKFEVENASIGVVDEDQSTLSRRIIGALLPPYFAPPVEIGANEIDPLMNSGRLIFVLEIPPKFEHDVLAGRRPTVQVNIDATAMTQAGNGASYLQNIIVKEAQSYAEHREGIAQLPINVAIRAAFNPNLRSEWFNSIMAVINNITMMAIILTGAALIREREHGTVEHLLVMPVKPAEIMLAKMWANGLVIVVAATLSLWFVVHMILDVALAGSIPLFVIGTILYQVSVSALGILLATFTTSMGQFGLLVVPVLVIFNLLSGSTTPMESMPLSLQYGMQLAPSTHFVSFAQAVLYRAAGIDIVWPQLVTLAAITTVFFGISLARFRIALMSAR
jgi:ABC-2 type transport system permease protein